MLRGTGTVAPRVVDTRGEVVRRSGLGSNRVGSVGTARFWPGAHPPTTTPAPSTPLANTAARTVVLGLRARTLRVQQRGDGDRLPALSPASRDDGLEGLNGTGVTEMQAHDRTGLQTGDGA